MLILPIKKKWFDMIKSGEKKEEYREIKTYWTSRLLKADIEFDIEKLQNKLRQNGAILRQVKFRNGYREDSPTIKCNVAIKVGKGKEEWGAEPCKEYYILEILEVLKQ